MKADELLALLERGWLGPPEEWEEAEEELARLIRTATEKRNIHFFVELTSIQNRALGCEWSSLIPKTKKLVQDQAAYLYVALRQKIVAIPQAWSRELARISDWREMQERLTTLSHELLRELHDMPRKVTDPNWTRGAG